MSDINPMPGTCIYSDILYRLVMERCGHLKSILELGCGTGGNLAEFSTTIRKIGIDPDEGNIGIAIDRKLLNCRFILGSHKDLKQFEHNEFNVGISLSVLDHIKNFKVALYNMMILCKELVLLEPTIKGENRQARKNETQRWKNTWYHDYSDFLIEQKVVHSIKPNPLYKNNSGPLFHLIHVNCGGIT